MVICSAASFGVAPILSARGNLKSNEAPCKLAVDAAGQPILGPNGEEQQECQTLANLGTAFFKRTDGGVFINCNIVSGVQAFSRVVAHEVGHTFGLDHDAGKAGTPGIVTVNEQSYLDTLPNPADGVRRWTAIMATSTSGPVVHQWSKGEYAGESGGGAGPLLSADPSQGLMGPLFSRVPYVVCRKQSVHDTLRPAARGCVLSSGADNQEDDLAFIQSVAGVKRRPPS
jgi:hypothetical protein